MKTYTNINIWMGEITPVSSDAVEERDAHLWQIFIFILYKLKRDGPNYRVFPK